MDIKKIKSFEFENRNYEIYTIKDLNRIEVRIFTNRQPANGYVYMIDAATILGNKTANDFVDDMITSAENDVREKMWDKYNNAVKYTK